MIQKNIFIINEMSEKFLDLDKMMMIALDNSKTKCEKLNCIFVNEVELIVIT